MLRRPRPPAWWRPYGTIRPGGCGWPEFLRRPARPAFDPGVPAGRGGLHALAAPAGPARRRRILPGPAAAWWRAVNEGLLRDAWEADRLATGSPGPRAALRSRTGRLPPPAQRRVLYRAHNASIVAGYLEHQELCAAELPIERFFMNVTLSRVLYAHALVARPKLALGRMRAVSRPLGDPRWRGADLFLSLHNILPDRYPLDGITLERDPGPGEPGRPPDRLRRHPAPDPGAVRLGRGRPRRAPAARPGPRRPARLRLDQRRAPSLDARPRPPDHARPDLADLGLNSSPLSFPRHPRRIARPSLPSRRQTRRRLRSHVKAG